MITVLGSLEYLSREMGLPGLSVEDLEVILARYTKYAGIRGQDECWKWEGELIWNGYGRMFFAGKRILAHRLSTLLFKGDIPAGYEPDHLCRERSCTNPDHLEVVTRRENIIRGNGAAAINHRKTHCPRGHALGDPAQGKVRRCKICKNLQERRRRKLRP